AADQIYFHFPVAVPSGFDASCSHDDDQPETSRDDYASRTRMAWWRADGCLIHIQRFKQKPQRTRPAAFFMARSEERRVGNECRSRRVPCASQTRWKGLRST